MYMYTRKDESGLWEFVVGCNTPCPHPHVKHRHCCPFCSSVADDLMRSPGNRHRQTPEHDVTVDSSSHVCAWTMHAGWHNVRWTAATQQRQRARSTTKHWFHTEQCHQRLGVIVCRHNYVPSAESVIEFGNLPDLFVAPIIRAPAWGTAVTALLYWMLWIQRVRPYNFSQVAYVYMKNGHCEMLY